MSGDFSSRTSRMALIGLAIVLFVSAPAVRSGIVAWAHTHADNDGKVNWYPVDCCHDGECRPVATISRASHGIWFTTVDGVTILVDARAERRPSKDMRWHICIGMDDTETPFVRCIFEPSGS